MHYIKKTLIQNTFYIAFIGLIFATYAQEKEFNIHTVAFYNLENLFDPINDPNKLDEYSPIMELKSNREDAYQKKIRNMARVLSEIGSDKTGHSPSIIGVCEVENRMVLEDLLNDSLLVDADYGIVHFDAPDVRGIDVALLYRKNVFTPTNSSTHELRIFDDQSQKRVYTRDQLLVTGTIEGEEIHFIVNHWPSRRGGEKRSEPKRIAAAKLNKYLIDSLQTANPYAKIITMGDLNDNPNNKSVKNVLNAKNKPRKVGLKGIYNPYIDFYKNGLGTTAYRDNWFLFDQILITKPFLEKDYASLRFHKANIFNKNYLIEDSGTYKGYPFRSWGNGGFKNGFSDHFPVYIYLIKEAR